MGSNGSTWPQEIIDRIVGLAQPPHNHSLRDIANIINAEFGTSHSRSAVVGKLNRLGISNKSLPKEKPVRVRPVSAPRLAKGPTLPSVAPVELAPSPDALNVSLMQLEDGMCKWPTNDDSYCGHATGDARQSYCTAHRKAGTTPARYSVHKIVGRVRR